MRAFLFVKKVKEIVQSDFKTQHVALGILQVHFILQWLSNSNVLHLCPPKMHPLANQAMAHITHRYCFRQSKLGSHYTSLVDVGKEVTR